MENYHFYQLNNQIRGVHQELTSSPIAHFGITIKSGSREEREDEQGLAHFIEHTIFKGTTKRKPFHILSRLDVVGGELNAYTTKEETCIYASFLSGYYERAMELISDILFNSVFPKHEIEKEKDVVIDEINSYLDSPSEQIFDDFEEQIFQGHTIGRNILGTKKSVKSFTQEDLIRFLKRTYIGEHIVFSSIGNISPKKIEKLAHKYFEFPLWSKTKVDRTAFNNYKTKKIELEKDTHQAHCLMGVPSFDMHHPRRREMVLLNSLLGGMGLNSRLNLNIREKHGVTYTIESNYSAYSDTGLFSIYFGSEKVASARIIKLVFKELNKLKETSLGIKQLHQSKEQLKGHIALAQENKVNLMLALGKSLLYFDKIDTNQEIFDSIDKITSSDLLDLSNMVFQEDQLSMLIYN